MSAPAPEYAVEFAVDGVNCAAMTLSLTPVSNSILLNERAQGLTKA